MSRGNERRSIVRDDAWPVGCRDDDASRAIAAYPARRRSGYSATSVAKALGYAHPSSVRHAMSRIDAGSAKLKQTVKRLERRLKRHSNRLSIHGSGSDPIASLTPLPPGDPGGRAAGSGGGRKNGTGTLYTLVRFGARSVLAWQALCARRPVPPWTQPQWRTRGAARYGLQVPAVGLP